MGNPLGKEAKCLPDASGKEALRAGWRWCRGFAVYSNEFDRQRPGAMATILELLQGREVRRFEAGHQVLQQGETTGQLYVLIEGAVEVLKDDVVVASASQPGVVFGEMAVLLGGSHTATVRASRPCRFHVLENPREFLRAHPDVCLFVCELLARRLDSLNKYLVDVKHQFEGHDHIGMVDKVLESLMHRQPRARARPSESTLRHGEQAD